MLARGAIETSGTSIPGVVQIRGTNAGLYFRAKTCHAGQHSPGFRTLLSRHVYLDEQWVNVVTGAQKAGWATYAAANTWYKESGRAVVLNQYQVFIKININLMTLGLPYSPNKPAGSAPGPAPVLDYDLPTPQTLRITFDNTYPWTTDPHSFCLVVDHGPVGPAWTQKKRFSRLAGILPGIPGVGYPAPVIFTRPYTVSLTSAALIRTYVVQAI